MTNAFGVSKTVPIKPIIDMTHNDYSSLLLLKNNIYALFLYQRAKLIRRKIAYSILKIEDWIFCQLCDLVISNEVV